MIKKTALTVGAAIVVMALAGCAGGGTPTSSSGPEKTSSAKPDPEEVKVVIPAQSAQFWDIYIADAEGFFAENGIVPEITLTPGPAATLAALSGGAADVGTPFAEQGLAAMEKGAPISVFVGESNVVIVSVVGTKDVTTADDLRNQKIASSNIDDVATLMMERWLVTEGVMAGDFDKIIVGSSGARYQALVTGAAAGATLIAPVSLQAIREGYPLIKDLSEPGVMTAHFGTDSFLEDRPEAAARYAKSMQQAVSWLLDPANEEAAVEILIDRTGVGEADAQATYDLYIGQEDVFLEGSPIDPELLKVSLGYLEETGRVGGNPDPADYINPDALKAAAEIN